MSALNQNNLYIYISFLSNLVWFYNLTNASLFLNKMFSYRINNYTILYFGVFILEMFIQKISMLIQNGHLDYNLQLAYSKTTHHTSILLTFTLIN